MAEFFKLKPDRSIAYIKRSSFLSRASKRGCFEPVDLLTALAGDYFSSQDLSKIKLSEFVLATSAHECLFGDVTAAVAATFFFDENVNIFTVFEGSSSGFEALRLACLGAGDEARETALVVSLCVCPEHRLTQIKTVVDGRPPLPKGLERRHRPRKHRFSQQLSESFLMHIEECARKMGVERVATDAFALQCIQSDHPYASAVVPLTSLTGAVKPIDGDVNDFSKLTEDVLRIHKQRYGKFGILTDVNVSVASTGAGIIALDKTNEKVMLAGFYRFGYQNSEIGSAAAIMAKEICDDFGLSESDLDAIVLLESCAAHALMITKKLKELWGDGCEKRILKGAGGLSAGLSPALSCHVLVQSSVDFILNNQKKIVLALAETEQYKCYGMLFRKV